MTLNARGQRPTASRPGTGAAGLVRAPGLAPAGASAAALGRSSGPIGRLTPAPRFELYEPLRGASEHALIYGYSHATRPWDEAWPERVEHCACGRDIRSIDADRPIATAVELHNASPDHVAWRRRQGIV